MNIPEDIFFGFYQREHDIDPCTTDSVKMTRARTAIVNTLRKELKKECPRI